MFWKSDDRLKEDLNLTYLLIDARNSMLVYGYMVNSCEFNFFVRRVGLYNLFIEHMNKNEKVERCEITERQYNKIKRIVLDSCAKNTFEYERLDVYLKICKKLGILDRLKQDITNKKFIRWAEAIEYL